MRVNLEAKGDLIVLIAQDGDVLVSEEEFKRLGLAAAGLRRVVIRTVPYVSLRSAQVRYTLDQAKLELAITVDPKVIAGRRVVDLMPLRAESVLRPEAAGSFVNYNITASGEDRSGWQSAQVAAEAGLRFGEYLFLTDGTASTRRSQPDVTLTRLSTSLVRERLETFQRTVFGDFVTTPGALGTSLRLGGLSLSKRFAIDPYFVRYPGQVVSGTATLPSDVYLYSNGILIRRERIPPGSYEFQNIVNLNGLGVTEVVVRDVMGNEQRIVSPYYFTESVLRAGLDEYSVDAGWERRNFGTASNDYGKTGAAGFYRRGVSDDLTLGGRGEWLEGGFNAGPTATARLGLFGIGSIALDYGQYAGKQGWAYALSHSYNAPRFGTSFAVRGESRDHPALGLRAGGSHRLDAAGSVSFSLPGNASAGFSFNRQELWEGEANSTLTLSYRQRFLRDFYLSVIAQHKRDVVSDTELSVSLSYSFDKVATRPTLDLQARHNRQTDVQTVQVAGGTPEGEGLEYRLNVDIAHGPDGRQVSGNPYVQYNFPRAVARAEYVRVGDSGGYQLGLSGAIAAVGGAWGFSRPITDGFGFVKVGDIPDVSVYSSNLFSGKTRSDGTLFIPRLASHFENPIAIDDRELPMNVVVPEVRYVVVPAYRSGVFLDFKARRVLAVAGRLALHRGGAREGPFGQATGEVRVGDRTLPLYTSRDGSFYAEDVGPGDHPGIAQRGGERCAFTMRVPETKDAVAELGEVRCNETP